MYASLKKRVNNAQANAPAGRAILICMYWNALFSCTPLVIHYHFCRNADLVSGMTRQRWKRVRAGRALVDLAVRVLVVPSLTTGGRWR